jgi:hypothetical protein
MVKRGGNVMMVRLRKNGLLDVVGVVVGCDVSDERSVVIGDRMVRALFL